MSRLYFDIWPDDDYEGTALGELTDAFDKQTRDADQAIGQGQFRINRHSAQAAWCVPRALVRVRRVAGGPFAFDDSRYFFAFFLENSADVVLSPEEEGGEVLSRGGESAITFLKRAVIYPGAEIVGHRSYWRTGRTQGVVIFPNATVGEALRILILNAKQRVPDPLEGLTLDWTNADDSSSTPWPETTTDWKFNVGTDLLTVLGQLVSSQSYFRITPDFVLSAYDEHPGADLSASITFAKGVDLVETAERSIDARGVISRALVRGAISGNRIQYFQAIDAPWETDIGRVEGYVEYTTTANQARLVKRGLEFVRKSRLQHDGPTTSGVLESTGKIPYTDYVSGDLVTLDIPGVYDTEVVRVSAIVLTETDNGEYDVTLEFNDAPWDPATGPGGFGQAAEAAVGGCGDCPELPPFAPEEPEPDVILEFCNTVMIDSGREGSATSAVSWIIGETYYYRITNTAHSATAITDDFLFTGSGTGQVPGALPDGADEGTIVPTLAGAIGASASADYGGAPTVNECWKVEIWIGVSSIPADVPVSGQRVIESDEGDGAETCFQTNYPYEPNSLFVYVGGVQVIPTQTDPETGDFCLPFAPATGAQIVLDYMASSNIPTGADNEPSPPSVTPTGAVGIPATLLDAKGDIITATAADTPVRKAAGANDTILMADSGQSDGLKWVGSQTPTTQDYDDVAAQGTADTYARGDHLHGMPSAGGGGSITVEEEGTPLTTAATTLDFVGAGVTASGTGATKTITIPGGGGGDPFDGKPYIWTPPGSAATEDDEFNDATGMSGPVNGLDAQWTKRNLGTASWLKLDDAVAPGCAYFDIPTGQASDQAIYQTVPAGDWTFAAHMHGHRSSDRQYWGVFCVSSAGTGIMAVMDTGADTSNGLRTLTTWADGGAGTFHGEAAWNTDENGLNRNPSAPVTVTLRKASGVYHMGYSYSHRLLPGNYFEISHTPTAFTAAFIGVGRFGPGGTAGVSKVTIDFFRKVA